MASISNSKLLALGSRASHWLLWRELGFYPRGGRIKCELHQCSEAQRIPERDWHFNI